MDTQPLDVVFDISILDSIGASTFNRAGIFRVVERVALELARRPECRLAVSCSNPILDVDAVLKAAARVHPELAGIPSVQLWRSTRELKQLTEAIAQVRKRSGEGVVTKIRRKLLRMRAARIKHRAGFNASVLPAGGIFHSPWEPLPPAEPFRARDVRRVLTIYDMTPVLFPHFFQDTLVFRSILASIQPDDHILAISECTKRDFCELTRHDPARVHVTPLAADPGMFSPVRDPQHRHQVRAKYGIGDGPYLLSVNTMQPRKNLAHCVESFCRLVRQERLPDLSLVLVGDRGWKTGDVNAALRQAGLVSSRVIVTGYVPDEDLAALYSGALAFVYVSHYEGFGLPPLEAMQCGVPVIAANNSSLPEVVGDAGILVPTSDSDALCAAMLSLYRDAALRDAYATRAIERARRFSWQRCAELTVAAYRRIQAA